MDLPPEGGETQGCRGNLQGRVSQDCECAGRHCASPGRLIRTEAHRPSVLQLARGRRRGPSGSGQEHLLLEQGPGAHGAVAQAVRVHAFDAIRWGAIGGGFELQGHDLPAGGDFRRRRNQRPQPRADGARRSQEQGQEGIRGSAAADRPDAGGMPRVGGSAPRNQAAYVPRAAHQRRGGHGGELRDAHRGADQGGSRELTRPARPNDGVPMDKNFYIGMDVGSTTVKAVVIDAATDQILWQDYQRHDTKQPEKVLEFLMRFEAEIAGFSAERSRIFITGSGGNGLGGYVGAKFVQEVNAVSLAVERMYPACGSVIELGGQDAKIIIFKTDPETGRKKKIPSMNDKCAGGTGAVIDKINAKLRIPSEQLCQMGYVGVKLHPVAGKCGVFAETDINGLQKMGVPPDELMASLFEAIVMQNLSVLTRGNTLLPVVLLLGGPNCYIKGMRDCWKANIPKIWQERGTPLPEGIPPEDLIRTPDNAQYFAAIGSVEFGKSEDDNIGRYIGFSKLAWYVNVGREEEKAKRGGGVGLTKDDRDLASFKEKYRTKKFIPEPFYQGEVIEGFIGIDGGSTSTKAVLMSKDHKRRILAKTYQLSKGNPIEDTVEVLQKLDSQIRDSGAELKILGVGTTGYAKDILKDVVGADAALVETVAHTEAGLHFYEGVDVICDVGGQDIKIIILKDGRVKDFKLNKQCRSEEHTSELQSLRHLVCRLL